VAGEDAHGRRFAGAVGAEETDDLSALDLERNIADGGVIAVILRELANVDHDTPLQVPGGGCGCGAWAGGDESSERIEDSGRGKTRQGRERVTTMTDTPRQAALAP